MGIIEETFKRLISEGEKALVSYLMVGYPDYETSLKAFFTVLENGTDILEVGFPFSDPVADGPTIQEAHEVALKNGIKLKDVLKACKEIKSNFPDVPILLMSYYNPIYRTGIEKFCSLAKENGVDGFIVPDLPPEEAEELKEVMKTHELSLVLLSAPTSTEERLKKICRLSDGMIYMVSVTGTTGAREKLPLERIKEKVKLLKSFCNKYVVVGFGVSTKEHSKAISEFADGVVVGSLLVKLSKERDFKKLAEKVKELKEGAKVIR